METKRFQKIVMIIGCVLVMIVWSLTIYNLLYNTETYPKYINSCPMYFKRGTTDISCHLDISTVDVNNTDTCFNDISGCKPLAYQHSNDYLINHENKCKSFADITTNDVQCSKYGMLSWKGILDYEHINKCNF